MRYDWNRYAGFVKQKLDELKVPGAAVCVCDNSGILFSSGFGYCDAEHKHEVKPDTIFGIASMSKSATCLAAAWLENEGRRDLGDPACKLFTPFPVARCAE